MRGIAGGVALAIFLGVGVTTQEQGAKERTKVGLDDARTVTWTGCVRAAKDGFDLTEITRAKSAERQKAPRAPASVMLRQLPDGPDLRQYVGRRVAITGATEKDVFEDIEVKVETEKKVGQTGQPETKTKAKSKIETDPGGHNILVPVSVREISKTCSK
jgi:hypothetical protein